MRKGPRHPRGCHGYEKEVALRREVPARSAAQITDIIGRAHGWWLSERTVRVHLARTGVSRQVLLAEPAPAFGRFEDTRPNERWIDDVLVGPFIQHLSAATMDERQGVTLGEHQEWCS